MLTHLVYWQMNHVKGCSYISLYWATLYLKLILDGEIVCLRFTLNLEYRGTELKSKLSFCMCACSVILFSTLWTVAHQASLSMEFFKQEYWSGLPFPPTGNRSLSAWKGTSVHWVVMGCGPSSRENTQFVTLAVILGPGSAVISWPSPGLWKLTLWLQVVQDAHFVFTRHVEAQGKGPFEDEHHRINKPIRLAQPR